MAATPTPSPPSPSRRPTNTLTTTSQSAPTHNFAYTYYNLSSSHALTLALTPITDLEQTPSSQPTTHPPPTKKKQRFIDDYNTLLALLDQLARRRNAQEGWKPGAERAALLLQIWVQAIANLEGKIAEIEESFEEATGRLGWRRMELVARRAFP